MKSNRPQLTVSREGEVAHYKQAMRGDKIRVSCKLAHNVTGTLLEIKHDSARRGALVAVTYVPLLMTVVLVPFTSKNVCVVENVSRSDVSQRFAEVEEMQREAMRLPVDADLPVYRWTR